MFLFLSDAHIGIGTAQDQLKRKRYLFECLDHYAPQMEKLFIIGDLFDFWFEWRHAIVKHHFDVLHKLKVLTQKGIQLHYLAGNHDFALSSFLSDIIGAEVHLSDYEFEADGKKFYVNHGDGLALNDRGYRVLKRILRNKLNQKLFRLIHPDLGVYLARKSSHYSRNSGRRRWDIDNSAYLKTATELIEGDYDYVIFGHNHEPLFMPLNGGIYINTGDWMKFFSYATYDGKGMALKYWNLPFLTRTQNFER